MNDQPMPPNSAGPGERPMGARPEDLQTGAPEQTPRVEAAPAADAAPASAPSSNPATPPKLTADDVAAALAATPTPASSAVPTPTIAGDVDVIEPEWVDKAEHVVAEHRGDPYGEEEAIENLQQDYLKKRYNYDVANPNSDSSKPEGT